MMVEAVASIVDPSADAQAPGVDDLLFITDQQRGIHVVENGVHLPHLFLDVDAEAAANGGLHFFGLTSLAFHPGYATNGRFYVAYMDWAMFSHVVEYRVSPSDRTVADPASRVQILGPQPNVFHSHNWNQIWFGPDGMLYVATGDGQQSASSTLNVSQDLSSINGKILRLDVDAPVPHVPADNPFHGTPGVDERIFASGLRQPWRSAHDPVTSS